MYRRRYSNFRFISVMFWSFPYLLWQAFGNISGFIAVVILAVVLTMMLNSLIRQSNWNTIPCTGQHSLQAEMPQTEHRREAELYQSGYQAETEPYRGYPQPYQVEECQPQQEEMQVPYPEMPPMKQ